MNAAQTKEREEEEHNGIRKEKIREVGTRRKSKKIVLKASIVTKLPVSATKPSLGPCCTICHLPALVNNGIKCRYCRCRAPSCEQINENQTILPGLGGCSNSGSTY